MISIKLSQFIRPLFWGVGFFILSSSAEEIVFRDSSGRTGKYKIERSGSAAKIGVLIYFHGSGATTNYAANFSELSMVARRFDLTPVALQAPDGAITWAEKGPPSGRIPYAHELLQTEIFTKSSKYDINKTIFVGISAGATFVGGDFLPSHIKSYGGGAVLLCGGAAPMYPIKLAGYRQDFKMFVAIHPTDFLFGQTIGGVDFWRNRGLTVKTIQPAAGGHCGFDLNSAMLDGVRFILGK